MSEACSCGMKQLIFSCSGASDVGEIADRAARTLTREGCGRMYCLTGIGGRVPSIVKTAMAAESIVAIDGCAQACARHILEATGFGPFHHLQLGDLGLEKGASPVTDEAVRRAADAAGQLLQG